MCVSNAQYGFSKTTTPPQRELSWSIPGQLVPNQSVLFNARVTGSSSGGAPSRYDGWSPVNTTARLELMWRCIQPQYPPPPPPPQCMMQGEWNDGLQVIESPYLLCVMYSRFIPTIQMDACAHAKSPPP